MGACCSDIMPPFNRAGGESGSKNIFLDEGDIELLKIASDGELLADHAETEGVCFIKC